MATKMNIINCKYNYTQQVQYELNVFPKAVISLLLVITFLCFFSSSNRAWLKQQK